MNYFFTETRLQYITEVWQVGVLPSSQALRSLHLSWYSYFDWWLQHLEFFFYWKNNIFHFFDNLQSRTSSQTISRFLFGEMEGLTTKLRIQWLPCILDFCRNSSFLARNGMPIESPNGSKKHARVFLLSQGKSRNVPGWSRVLKTALSLSGPQAPI